MGVYSGERARCFRMVSGGTTAIDRQTITTVPTQLAGVQAFNLSSASLMYLHIFDSTAIVSTGGGEAVKTFMIPYSVVPTGTTAVSGSGFVYAPAIPVTLSSGLTFALGANAASSAAYTTIGAGLAVINIDYIPSRAT